MSGKENASAAGMSHPGSPTSQVLGSDQLGSGTEEIGSAGSAEVNDGENQNDELFLVTESLNQIEAILKAESKRRIEANSLTDTYISDYLDKLEQSLNTRVLGQF